MRGHLPSGFWMRGLAATCRAGTQQLTYTASICTEPWPSRPGDRCFSRSAQAEALLARAGVCAQERLAVNPQRGWTPTVGKTLPPPADSRAGTRPVRSGSKVVRVFLYMGRLVATEKTWRPLLKAWRWSAPRAALLLIVGDGPLRGSTDGRAPTTRDVEWVGAMSRLRQSGWPWQAHRRSFWLPVAWWRVCPWRCWRRWLAEPGLLWPRWPAPDCEVL